MAYQVKQEVIGDQRVLAHTESLCPVCLGKIPAKRVVKGNNVFLEKACTQHGDFKTLLWRDAELYQEWGQGEEAPGSDKRFTRSDRGCPYDCGLCPNHRAQTCTVLMEVTDKCDISCPVCFASANGKHGFQPDINGIREMYETIIEAGGPCPVQLSGGEPTTRDDLPEIVAMGKKMGFEHIQINTHGIRLARDRKYLQRLKESGTDLIYLQFDGISDDVYRHTRGADLFDLKIQAIENCAEVKLGVLLVPTLIPSVNDHQIGDIVRFAKTQIPTVKGIHFQPISYFGRYPRPPEDRHRITISDVLSALESQTGGEVKANHFLPRRRSDSHCGFSGFFVITEDGRLQATTVFERRQTSGARCSDVTGGTRESPSEHVRRFISQRGRFVEAQSRQCECKRNSWQSFFERAQTHYLSISGMPFQDVWTIDLERLQGCCIHVVTSDKRLVPFCAFYLTSTTGKRLHQNSRSMSYVS